MQLVAERPDGVHIHRAENTADGEAWCPAFAGAYQEIWSEPPYNERFSTEEASAILARAVRIPDQITLLGVRESGVVVGVGMAVYRTDDGGSSWSESHPYEEDLLFNALERVDITAGAEFAWWSRYHRGVYGISL